MSFISTPVGSLALITQNNRLCSLKYCRAISEKHQSPTLFGEKVVSALNEYFFQQSPLPKFPFNFFGTPFQKKVWLALCRIPFGETRTYGELSELLNTSAQAIGNACRENPISIIVPCHRIVSREGIGGYGGKVSGTKIKTKIWLLQNEGAL